MEQTTTMQVSISELFFYIRKKLWAVISVALICLIGTALVCKLVITPQYTASTRIYVQNKLSNESSNLGYSDFQAASQIRKDYEVLITGINVTSKVIENMSLPMSDAQLASKISVSSPNDTRFLQINVTDEAPTRAAAIANQVRLTAQKQIEDIMNVGEVKLVYEARVPTVPSSPHTMRNVILITALGTLLSLVALVILFLVDDRIKNEEDVERYLNLSTIGVIPASEALQKRTYYTASKQKAKKAKKK